METNENKDYVRIIIQLSKYIVYTGFLTVACLILVIATFLTRPDAAHDVKTTTAKQPTYGTPGAATTASNGRSIPANAWRAPDDASIPAGKDGDMIRYGKELVIHTALYFGPKGSIAQISNGMNCQNCHLDAGTRYLGNNYASFMATYPKFSGRADKVVPPSERMIECFERSLAGKTPDTTKREIQSILAYMRWIGKDVKKGDKVVGAGIEKLAFLDRAADPIKGNAVYMMKCQSCHGANGEGLLNADAKSYQYPPLWGKHSYNDGAGMYRLTNLAGFVKNNMPFGATFDNPQLTDEEAWDVAAFVDSQPRGHKDQHNDWRDISKKPIDLPFGPYLDTFSEKQHKYGPFAPINAAKQRTNPKTS